MSLAKEQLQRELEQVLDALMQIQGEELARQLKPILQTNLARGRVKTFVEDDSARVQQYVWLVSQNFSKLKTYLHKLQNERDRETWDPLFARMQTWAYTFFRRKGFHADDHTREIAGECAADAAAILLKSYFPYDTEFDPWAHTIVQHACQKYIHKAMKKSEVPEDKKAELNDELRDPREALPDVLNLQKESGRELLEALRQLSASRRTVILSIYFDEMSFEEIAQSMGKNVSAIYSLHFNALEDLRKILGTNRDNIND